jgi:signal peptidase
VRWKRYLSTTTTIVLILAWVVLLRPQAWGGPASYVMVSGESMEPALSNGDFVVARAKSDYQLGDIVVYRVPVEEAGAGALVIHRLVDRSADGSFVMQGDNRDTPDIWKPVPDQIAGELFIAIPAGARVLLLLRSPFIIALIAGFGAFLYIFLSGRKPEQDAASETAAPEEPAPAPGRQAAPVAVRSRSRSRTILTAVVAGAAVLYIFRRGHSP